VEYAMSDTTDRLEDLRRRLDELRGFL